MQFAGNADLAAALTGNNRNYTITLLSDWDGDLSYNHTHSDLSAAVESMDYDRTAGNDLPEQTTLVQGYQVGSLRVKLVGVVAGTEVTELFSTFRSTSPLFGEDLVGTRVKFEVTVETASGPVTVPQFVGVLRSVDTNSKDRSVDIEVLDLAGTLYALIDLPVVSVDELWLAQNVFLAHTNTQWIVDHVLRRNGIFTTPPPKSDAILSATGHGGLGAEVGFNRMVDIGDATTESTWTDSIWPGMLATPYSWGIQGFYLTLEISFPFGVSYITTGSVDLSTPGQGFAWGCWMNLGGSMTNVGTGKREIYRARVAAEKPSGPAVDLGEIWVELSSTGLLEVSLRKESPASDTLIHSRQLTGTESWRYLGFHVGRESSTVLRASVRCDGTTTSGTINPGAIAAPMHSTEFMAGLIRPWSNLQVWKTPTAPTGIWPGESSSHTAEASVPVGNAYMSYLPDTSSSTGLDVLKSAVGAEYGSFGFDESGFFSWAPADYAPADTTNPDRTLTAEFPLTDLGSDRHLDSVRNDITSVVRERGFSSALDQHLFVAKHRGQLQTPANGRKQFVIPLVRAFGGNGPHTTISNTTEEWWEKEANNVFIPINANTSAVAPNGTVGALFEYIDQRTGLLTIVNDNSFPVNFNVPSDNDRPAFRIRASDLGTPVETKFKAIDETSLAKFGLRSYGISPSEWRSRKGPYDDIAGGLLIQLRKPVTTLNEVHMIGDPRDQIGDLHEIQDPDGIGESIFGLVQGINRSYSRANGLQQTIQYRVQQDQPQNSYRALGDVTVSNLSETFDHGDDFNLGNEFYVTSTSWVTTIWYYRNNTQIVGEECSIFKVDSSTSGTLVPGTNFSLPAPSGTGWQSITLPKPVILEVNQRYRVCVLFTSGDYNLTLDFWEPGNPGAGGFTDGPLVMTGQSDTIGGDAQSSYARNLGSAFPTTYVGGNAWIDVTVVDNPYPTS